MIYNVIGSWAKQRESVSTLTRFVIGQIKSCSRSNFFVCHFGPDYVTLIVG